MPVTTRSKSSLQPKKCKGRKKKRSIYENVLKHIELSNGRWQQLQAQKRLISNLRKASANKHRVFNPKKKDSLEDSVIILSDNECASKEGQNETKRNTNTKKRKSLLKKSNKDGQCTSTPNMALYQRNNDKKTHATKKRSKSRTALSDHNSSCLVISDIEDAENNTVILDNESIVPPLGSVNKESDDIVVIWSSTKTSSPTKNRSGEEVTNLNKDRLFMIDCSPNPKNLSCLEVTNETRPEPKAIEQSNAEKKNEENFLPFSKKGLRLPKAFNIGQKITMKKPVSPKRTRMLKCLKTKSYAANSNRIPVICNSYATTPFSYDMLREASSFELYAPEPCTSASLPNDSTNSQSSKRLREIVIDGNNVAMAYHNGKGFSEAGIKLVVDYFVQKGHSVKVFIPQYRKSKARKLLEKWYSDGIVVFTPSRSIGGKWITPYDDRFILEYATMCGGIVVSLDQYRDLYMEKPEWRDTIENRLLAPTFVGDYVMFPEDPLGRNGPKLEEFLSC